MKDFKKNILITGGAGFIGSHLARLLVNKYPEYRIINFDALTYAGNLENQRLQGNQYAAIGRLHTVGKIRPRPEIQGRNVQR